MSMLLYADTRQILGAGLQVLQVLGHGFLEKVYENDLVEEIATRNRNLV